MSGLDHQGFSDMSLVEDAFDFEIIGVPAAVLMGCDDKSVFFSYL